MDQPKAFNGGIYIHVALSGAAWLGLDVFVSPDWASIVN